MWEPCAPPRRLRLLLFGDVLRWLLTHTPGEHRDLLAYLVRRIDRSVPEAQRTVARLDEAADLEGRPVTRSLAKQVLDLDATSEDVVGDG